MALVVEGTVAAMAPGAEDVAAPGRVWLDDDGTVAAVTAPADAGPAGFPDDAPVVSVGDSAVIYPGLVDLHSHLGYNTLPLWTDPGQSVPYLHHDSWPGEPSYRPDVSWPAWTLAAGAPESLLAYVQVRALAGGTTSIQGWPSMSRSPSNRLVRCVDDDRVGPLSDPVRVSALTLEAADLRSRRESMDAGSIFIYHCSEGQVDSIVVREFADLDAETCLRPSMVCIHTNALEASDYRRWRTAARAHSSRGPYGYVVWSPFSNLWLYGSTTDVPAARDAGLEICLGTDWGPSGTHNLLGEAKVARLWSDARGWGLSDADIVAMMTSAPGDALARSWQTPVGRLVPGGLGDLVVVAQRRDDPWSSLVAARERDVELVVVGGRPRWGTTPLMRAAGAGDAVSVRIGRAFRRVALVRPDDPTIPWPWTDVLDRLDTVREAARTTPPTGPTGGRRRRPTEQPSADPEGTPPITVNLDMPGGLGTRAGPPPKGQTVDIPRIERVYHDTTWLRSVAKGGFHDHALDGLAAAFR